MDFTFDLDKLSILIQSEVYFSFIIAKTVFSKQKYAEEHNNNNNNT